MIGAQRCAIRLTIWIEVSILCLEVQLDRKTQQYLFSETNKSAVNLWPDTGLATQIFRPWKICVAGKKNIFNWRCCASLWSIALYSRRIIPQVSFFLCSFDFLLFPLLVYFLVLAFSVRVCVVSTNLWQCLHVSRFCSMQMSASAAASATAPTENPPPQVMHMWCNI